MPVLGRIEILRRLLARNAAARVTCAGSSMEPTLSRGAAVEIAAAGRVQAGDVVVLQAGAAVGDSLVVHRVLARLPAPGGALLVHGGDSAPRQCGFIREARVLGRVAAPAAAARPRPPARAAQIAFILRATMRHLLAR